MGVIIIHTLLALLLLALATGWYKPKKWNELSPRQETFLKTGCFFGFIVIVLNVVIKFL